MVWLYGEFSAEQRVLGFPSAWVISPYRFHSTTTDLSLHPVLQATYIYGESSAAAEKVNEIIPSLRAFPCIMAHEKCMGNAVKGYLITGSNC